MTLRLEDVRVDEYRRGDGRVMSMTLTHLPTGTVVHSDDVGDERTPLRLRDRLLEQLEAKVLEDGRLQCARCGALDTFSLETKAWNDEGPD